MMASLFPEIEVFTTGYMDTSGYIYSLWNLEWLKNTPSKFAKNLKVLDLTDFGYSSLRSFAVRENEDRFINNSNAVIDKLEADGVVHIGLVSFHINQESEDREDMLGYKLAAEFIAKILSRVTVDHIVFQNSGCLEQIYIICAQINAMHVQNPIHIYFQCNTPRYYTATDPCRPLQLRCYTAKLRFSHPYRESERIYDKFCFNLRLNPGKTDVGESQSFSPNQDHVDTCKMLTVHLGNMYSYNLRLRPSQGLSLEDFPNIEVNPYYDTYSGNIAEMCRDLGITSMYEWPIQVSLTFTNKATIAKDTKSACFDSRLTSNGPWPADIVDPYSMLNLSESLEKISPEVGPSHCVTVAVLDTGILGCHKEFLNKIVAMKNFVPNEANDLCYDFHGHGTSCAGIVLRTAPFVRLVICKVMSSQGHGRLTWAAEAIDWLLNDEAGPKNYCPVDIISMSFGCSSFDSDLRRAVSEAVGRGKVVVAAASNDGRKKLTNIAFPARFGDVICVGSCNNLGQPSSFTPTGREIDFLAPGEDIQAPSSSYCEYQIRSGTSEATPMVVGIAAMVISYAETTGGRTMRSTVSHTAVMREVLRKMASMPGHHDEHMGYGNLDPWRLFKYGPDHFRQVVEEIVGPLPVEAHAHQPAGKPRRQRRASESEVHVKKVDGPW